jgi:hypothetical protein
MDQEKDEWYQVDAQRCCRRFNDDLKASRFHSGRPAWPLLPFISGENQASKLRTLVVGIPRINLSRPYGNPLILIGKHLFVTTSSLLGIGKSLTRFLYG